MILTNIGREDAVRCYWFTVKARSQPNKLEQIKKCWLKVAWPGGHGDVSGDHRWMARRRAPDEDMAEAGAARSGMPRRRTFQETMGAGIAAKDVLGTAWGLIRG